MFEIILENESGLQLNFGPGTDFTIKEFSGLNPPKATINTSTTALIDGGIYNSSKLNMRSINIAFAVEQNAAENRLEVYKVIQNKRPIKVYYKSEVLDIWIEGYVEETDFSYFAQKNVCTVSILCPSPFFKSAREIVNELSATHPKFHFPFGSLTDEEIYEPEYHPEYALLFGFIDTLTSAEVTNKGYVDTGLTFELYCQNPVENPTIVDYVTGKYMKLNFAMQQGDLITITTGPGNKKVKLLRNAVESNIFSAFDPSSTWLQLPPGGSMFTYGVDEGNPSDLRVTIKHYDLYGGV